MMGERMSIALCAMEPDTSRVAEIRQDAGDYRRVG